MSKNAQSQLKMAYNARVAITACRRGNMNASEHENEVKSIENQKLTQKKIFEKKLEKIGGSFSQRKMAKERTSSEKVNTKAFSNF